MINVKDYVITVKWWYHDEYINISLKPDSDLKDWIDKFKLILRWSWFWELVDDIIIKDEYWEDIITN